MSTTPPLEDRVLAFTKVCDAIGKLEPGVQRAILKAVLAFLKLNLYEPPEPQD